MDDSPLPNATVPSEISQDEAAAPTMDVPLTDAPLDSDKEDQPNLAAGIALEEPMPPLRQLHEAEAEAEADHHTGSALSPVGAYDGCLLVHDFLVHCMNSFFVYGRCLHPDAPFNLAVLASGPASPLPPTAFASDEAGLALEPAAPASSLPGSRQPLTNPISSDVADLPSKPPQPLVDKFNTFLNWTGEQFLMAEQRVRQRISGIPTEELDQEVDEKMKEVQGVQQSLTEVVRICTLLLQQYQSVSKLEQQLSLHFGQMAVRSVSLLDELEDSSTAFKRQYYRSAYLSGCLRHFLQGMNTLVETVIQDTMDSYYEYDRARVVHHACARQLQRHNGARHGATEQMPSSEGRATSDVFSSLMDGVHQLVSRATGDSS
ncbi:uncharacterized protein MONBRDRAFT_5745 [Monosiga brevicollis MX1]|uniref:AH domain-containing protein n=1 Tax=Monosiga brevicollis TaxID=81824 RepID=A9USB9_MONBE|nr:uncharacterized protein MONBRDRAFT_5745 [Monosiga brevicollis MX1]EDQ92074.1 predicted protein [Monosiga brevicollis MX1]|eukprot:XP_001743360.1 hypothetical protein [Monosiga brevicollis MX1]